MQMINIRSAVAFATLLITPPAMASDADVLACRATEDARISAGQCGVHGCDRGILRSQCGESREFLKSIDPHIAAYTRGKHAYDQACGRSK
jgi:hypothetical protein